MSALIGRYWQVYGNKKKSHTREKSVLDGIRNELGQKFVREVDGVEITVRGGVRGSQFGRSERVPVAMGPRGRRTSARAA
jgi:hypothetical protein